MKTRTKKLVQVALLIAIDIVLARFLSIRTPIVTIGFSFIPLAMVGMLHGPIYGAVAGMLADFIGAMLFPIGAYFPGFTLTTALSGATYGLILHKDKSWMRIILAACMVCIVMNLFLNTVWLSMIMGKGYLALLPTRITKELLMIPIQVIGIRLAWTKICSNRFVGAAVPAAQ